MASNMQFWEMVNGIRHSLKSGDLDDAQSIAAMSSAVSAFTSSSATTEEIALAVSLVFLDAMDRYATSSAGKNIVGALELGTLIRQAYVRADIILEQIQDTGVAGNDYILGFLESVTGIAENLTDDIKLQPFIVITKILQVANVAFSISSLIADDIKTKIEDYFAEFDNLHEELVAGVTAKTDAYLSQYQSRMQQLAAMSGLTVEELTYQFGEDGIDFSASFEQQIINARNLDIELSENTIARAREGRANYERKMNGEYVEATGLNVALTLADVENRVAVKLGEGSGVGSFDDMATSWLNEALKFSYTTALDKMQADILSDTHSDTLNTINAQLAGIINGYSHIDEADKAAILAGWQQKFAGEFALERNGSDALLLDEIARLKAEMARLGAGEGTSILDMPNPAETLAALMEQQDAALTATIQDYLSGFLGEFTDYVAGVDERQQQRNDLTMLAEAPVGLVDVTTFGTMHEYRQFSIRTDWGIDPNQGLYYYGDEYEVKAYKQEYTGVIGFDGSNASDVFISTTGEGLYPFFNGLSGDDYIELRSPESGYAYGGDGNDTVITNSNYSMITGEAGGDTIYSNLGDGNYFLDFIEGDNTLDDGNDNFYGKSGDDFVEAGGGDDYINAGDGANTVFGGVGADYIITGAGDDKIISDGFASFKVSDDFYGNIERVSMHEFSDCSSPDIEYDDFIDAGDGSNRIIAGAGDDYILSGAGDDVIIGDFSKSVGFANVVKNNEIPYSYHGNDYIFSGSGNDYVYGGGGDDYINGGSGNNYLYGDELYENPVEYLFDDIHAGKDTIISEGGNDVIYGGGGDDTINAGDGDNHVVGGTGSDNIVTGSGNDRVFGDISDGSVINGMLGDILLLQEYHGDDIISTGGGDDIVYAGGGNDYINGGDGNDKLYGDDAYDSAIFGDDTINGGHGDDYLSGGAGDDILAGEEGNDRLNGGEGKDILSGGRGDDYLTGGNGNDSLTGGVGNDHLHGGAGDDSYVIASGDGKDTIYDIAGQNSLIIQNSSFSSVRLSLIQGSVYLYHGNNDLLMMSLATASTLSSITFGDGNRLSQEAFNDLIKETLADDAQQAADSINALSQSSTVASSLNFFNGQLLVLNGLTEALDINNPASWIEAGATPASGTLRYFRDADGKVMAAVIDEYGREHVPDGAVTEYLRSADGSEQSFAASYISPTNLPSGTSELQGMLGDTSGYSAQHQILTGTQINAGAGNDVLFASDENSQLKGESGNDFLFGAQGNDSLYGGSGNDTLIGGAGDDRLEGGTGNDLYCYNLGDGSETIINTSYEYENDVLQFGAGIAPSDVSFIRTGNDLVLQINTDGGKITVAGYFNHDGLSSSAIDIIRFTDSNVSWDVDYIKGAVLTGTDQAEVIIGYEESDDIIRAGAGDDELFGQSGDDLLDGGAGNDLLDGGLGSDIYIFGRGYGRDTISNYISADEVNAGSIDGLRFDDTVTLEDIAYARINNDLVFKIKDSADAISISGWFNNGTNHKLNFVEFADGRRLDLAQVEVAVQTIVGDSADNILKGFETDDVLDGAAGNDQLYGGGGNDTYKFGRGDGQDIIFNHDNADLANLQSIDKLVFKDGVTLEDIEYYRSGNSLVFRIIGSTDTISIGKWFSEEGSNKLQAVEFADGRSLDLQIVDKKAREIHGDDNGNELVGFETDDEIFGYDGNDTLRANGGNDLLMGGAGDDILYASTGDDVLDGGANNDLLHGGTGSDTYLFGYGDGKDIIQNYDLADSQNPNSHDRLVFKSNVSLEDVKCSRIDNDLVFSLINSEDSITISNWFRNAESDKLQSVEFADGRSLDLAQVELDVRNIVGDAGDNILIGAATDDVLTGNSGNDQLEGGGGSDEYHFSRGWGQDIIHNFDTSANKIDKIVFADGIDTSEIKVIRLEDDLILELVNTADSIKIPRYFHGDGTSAYSLEQICFADGTVWQVDDVKAAVNIADETAQQLYGYSTSDEMWAGGGDDKIWGRAGDDTLHGEEGDDVLFGESGADVMHGGAGEDTLHGGDGDDKLIGGTGNDHLFGGKGNDSYLFASGDGNDVISDTSGINRIEFTDVNSQDIIIRRGVTTDNSVPYANNDAVIINLITGETIHIKLQLGTAGGIAEIVFADGTIWDKTVMQQKMLEGSDDNDVMVALNDGSIIDAGDGNDFLYGAQGNDELYGGAGDDVIEALNGDNQLFGGDGNDQIKGGGLLDGGAGNDVLEGTGQDTLNGGDGDDTLIVYSNAYVQNQNTLEGGKGNDTLYGGFGDDTYIFNLGDGADVIIERRQGEAYSNVEASNDTLQFGEGIAADDLMFIRSGSDLLIRHSNGTDSITVQNWFAGSAHYQLNLLTFTDGSALTAEQIESQLVTFGTEGDDSLFGSAQVDVIYGEAGDDYIDGRAGDDTLHGGNGNDTITGGAGDDLLLGGAGDDKYVYNPQTGQDTIDNTGGGFDGVFFTNGIDASRLSFSQDGDDLLILVDGDETQSVRVLNHFLGGDAAISYVQPSGGYMLTATQIAAAIAAGGEEPVDPTDPVEPVDPVDPVDPTEPTEPVDPGQGGSITPGLGGNDELTGTTADDVLLGGAGDDVLTGLAGNDRLFGGTGSDTYIYHAGQDLITEQGGTDKLIFSNGITFNQVASGLTKSGNDLILKVNGSNDNSVTLSNFFLGGAHLVENFEFETGGSISAAQIFGAFGLAVPTADAPAVNAVQGTAGNDTLNGSAAADILSGSHGNDRLNGGTGNDQLSGGRGNDTYVFSAGGGHDTIDNSGGGEDVLLFEGISFNQVASGLMKSGNDLVLNIGGSSDKVTLKNWFLGGDYVVPTIRFAAGGEISANQIFGAFGLTNPNPQGSLAYTDLPDERAFGNVFVGTGETENIVGSSDDDFIDAGNGNDIVNGGAGNDYLLGGRGNDTYLFGANDGHNTINNYDPTTGRTDVLRFAQGINPGDVAVQRDGDNLLLAVADTSVTVVNYFADAGASAYRLDQIQFVDGTVWDSSSVTQQLSAATSSMTSSKPAFAAMGMMSVTDDMPAVEPFAGMTAKRAYKLNEHERVFKLHSDRPAFERATDGKKQQDVIELVRTDRLHSSGNGKHTQHVVELEKIDGLHSSELTVVELAEQTAQLVGMDWQSMLQAEQQDTVIDSRYANLVDALNTFDSDNAEIGGNLAIQPKFEELYY